MKLIISHICYRLQGIEDFRLVDKDIREVENAYNVGSFDDAAGKDKLNFGLVEMVYKWAQNQVSSNTLYAFKICFFFYFFVYLIYIKALTLNVIY